MNNVVQLPVPAPTTPAQGTTMNAEQLVDKLLRLRAKIEEIKKKHKTELEKYNEAEGYLEGRLMDTLNQSGARSMRTEAGTFYTSKRVSVKVQEWSKTIRYIIDNEAWDLLEARVNKTSAQALVESMAATAQEGEEAPVIPGVSITSDYQLNVRR
jgi:hypothetical protein